MTVISLAARQAALANGTSADVRHLARGFGGAVPVDVLVESPNATQIAEHLLTRIERSLKSCVVLHDEAMLQVSRELDDLIAGFADGEVGFVSVAIGRRLTDDSADESGVALRDPVDDCAVVPSIVLCARGSHVVGVATAVAAPRSADSIVAATVSSSRAGLSVVLARHVLVLGGPSAEPLLRMSDASGIAITASGDLYPC
jgi:hypothetical protein